MGRDGAARSGYGDCRAARSLVRRRFLTAVGVEYEHNFNVTARILLNGDFDFRPICDFKELGVAKISRVTTCRLYASQWAEAVSSELQPLQFRGGVLLTTIPASPIAPSNIQSRC
jgi:hypothetical protein